MASIIELTPGRFVGFAFLDISAQRPDATVVHEMSGRPERSHGRPAPGGACILRPQPLPRHGPHGLGLHNGTPVRSVDRTVRALRQ